MNDWCNFKRHGTYLISSFFKHWEIVKPNTPLLVQSKLFILISPLHPCPHALLELGFFSLLTWSYAVHWILSPGSFPSVGLKFCLVLFFLFVSQSSSHTLNQTRVSFAILNSCLTDREFCYLDRTVVPAIEKRVIWVNCNIFSEILIHLWGCFFFW